MSVNARVRLRELLEELTESFRKASDPFKIDIKYFIEELRKILPELSDEDLIIDAEILEQLANIIKEQERWVIGRTSMLVLGPFIALLKISTLSKEELAKELAGALHPIVELEQVTWIDVLRGLNYLSTRKRYSLEELREQRVEVATEKDLKELGLLARIDLREIIREVEEKILRHIKHSKVIDYLDVVRDRDIFRSFLRAYAVSYLATTGRISLYYNPLEEKYYIVKACEDGDYQSVVIPFGVVADAN